MAYKRINDSYVNGCRKEYICDTDADFANLPEACTGSSAVSLESGKVYVVSTFGNWIPFGEGYVEKDPNAPLPAGLYVDGVMTASWDELVANGTITVEDNVITGSNTDALVGELVIAGGITEIADEGLRECELLTGVVIPNGVTSIGDHALAWSRALKKVTIPDSVTNIGGSAFTMCPQLESIVIPDSVTILDEMLLEGCGSLVSVTMGNSVESIGDCCFGDCSQLVSIVIPDSLTVIYDNAFVNCASLTNITFDGTMAEWNTIELCDGWNSGVPATYVTCTDGTVAL